MPRGPTQKLIMRGGGGGGGGGRGLTEVHLFISKKITTSEFVYPKKTLLFLAYPKKSLRPFFATQKSPSVFFTTQKNPGIFRRPKKITFGQISDTKKSLRTPPPNIKIREWGTWVFMSSISVSFQATMHAKNESYSYGNVRKLLRFYQSTTWSHLSLDLYIY